MFLLKIEENFNELMIKRAKKLELMKFIFITHFSKFDSKVFLTLIVINFLNVTLTKVVHVYVKEAMNAKYT